MITKALKAAASALALALVLAACNQQTPAASETPSPSEATTTDNAPSAADADAPERIDLSTPAGQARLREIVGGYLDMAQQELAANARPDPELADQFALLTVSESPNVWAVNLTAGERYAFLGACDDDCDNLDIELVNSANVVVASDLAPDDFPIVRYSPSATGAFTVRTHLRSCSVEPCQIMVRGLRE